MTYYQLSILLFNLSLSLPICSKKLESIITRCWNILNGKKAYTNIIEDEEKEKDHEELTERAER
jgi:hypothetical protein